jgi:hypothetical protein
MWRGDLGPWGKLAGHPVIQFSQPIKLVLRVGCEQGPLLRCGGSGIVQNAHHSFNIGAIFAFARESGPRRQRHAQKSQFHA